MNRAYLSFTILLFSIVVLYLSCSKEEAHLSGKVTAKDSGLPILNVQVQIEGSDFIVKTNFDGFYSFSKIPTDFKLVFTHSDFYSVFVDATNMKTDQTYRIDVSMKKK